MDGGAARQDAPPGGVVVDPRDPAVLLLGAVVVLAVVQALVLGEAARTAAAAIPYLAALVVVLVGTPVSVRLGDARTVLVAAVAGVVLAAWLVGVFVVALPTGVGEPWGFYRVKLLVTSPVGDHNTAAGVLLVGIVATAVLAARDRRWIAGVAVTTLGVVATLSRGAAVVLLVVGAGALVVRVRRTVALLVLTAGAGALALVVVLGMVLDATPPPDGPQDAGPVGASIAARGQLWARAADLATSHPVLGVGLGGFEQHVADAPPSDHAHNLVLHAGAEGGVPLVVVAVGLPSLLAVRVWRRRAEVGPTARGELALLGGAGLVTHAQIEILSGRIGYEVLLAFLLAAVASPAGRDAGRDGGPPTARR